jgi:hypothetical protein
VDLAVTLADGGETITDLAVLRDQREVFGPVASTPTAWRLLADIDEIVLGRLRSARAQAREVAWLQATETGSDIPAVKAGGRVLARTRSISNAPPSGASSTPYLARLASPTAYSVLYRRKPAGRSVTVRR